jgi:hypothetical protein
MKCASLAKAFSVKAFIAQGLALVDRYADVTDGFRLQLVTE